METAVGVFASRERAEEAVRRLLEHHVPEERIFFLTRSESEANCVGRQFGAHANRPSEGTAASEGVAVAAHLAIPGVGPVFTLGTGAGSLLGVAGAGRVEAQGTGVAGGASPSATSPAAGSLEDSAFFCRILNEGHSVIVVRTDSSKIAATACEILDNLGLSMNKVAAPKSSVAFRHLHGAVIADFAGKIELGGGAGLLRDTVQNFLDRGCQHILLNLEHVDFVDSAGLGELVRSHTAVQSRGGQLKLVKPSASVHHLLRLTRLDRIFDIAPDEFTALRAIRPSGQTKSQG